MESIRARLPQTRFEIFTKVPDFFFIDSLGSNLGYHPLLTDIGVAQSDPVTEDLPETIRRLDRFLPFDPHLIESTASTVKNLGSELVVCDIAPFGIAVADCAGLPSVLIENFTWDWIYEGYLPFASGLQPSITYLKDQFGRAGKHIQSMPICRPDPAADLVAPPAGRKPHTSRSAIRATFGVPEDACLVLITMGGIPDPEAASHELPDRDDLVFIIPGGSDRPQKNGNTILLPHDSNFYHPDLVNASDAIIGKAGYSTIAETYQAGIPFGYISRKAFRESGVLAKFIQKEMSGVEIPIDDFTGRNWSQYLPQLLELPRYTPAMPDGGGIMADFLLNQI
jgi:hypothetical protein